MCAHPRLFGNTNESCTCPLKCSLEIDCIVSKISIPFNGTFYPCLLNIQQIISTLELSDLIYKFRIQFETGKRDFFI